MKRIYTLLYTALLLALSATSYGQTTYYSQTTTNLHLAANWNTAVDGSGTAAPNFTNAADIFEIDNEVGTVTIGAAWTVSGTVQVGNGTNAVTLSTNGFLITGTYNVANLAVLEVNTNSSFTLGTCATGSTVSYNGDLTQGVRGGTYHHLILTNATAARTKTASAAITVNGDLTINANNTLAMTTFQLVDVVGTIAGTGSITTTNTGTTPLPNSKVWTQSVTYSAATSGVASGTYENLIIATAGTKTAQGAITVNTTLNVSATLAMSTFNLAGAFTPISAGTITTNSTSATPLPSGLTWPQTVQFNGTASQTVSNGTYQNLQINGGSSAVKTANGNIAVPGTLTIAATTIFDMATNDITSVGTYANSGTLRTQSTSAAPIPANETIGGTVLYNGALAQTVVHGTYAVLNLAGGDRTLSNAGNINISGNFTTGSGAIAATGTTIVLTGAGNPQTITLDGQTNLVLENLTIASASTNSKTFNSTSACSLTVNGILEIQASRLLTLGTNVQLFLGMGSSFVGTGTLSTASTANPPIPNSITWPFIVNYSSTGTQTVSTGTYGRLFITGAGTSTANGTITVNDSLNVATGTFALSTFDLTGTISGFGGTGIGGTGTISTNSTSVTPIPTGRTWTQTVQYNGAVAQTVVAGTYANLQVNGGSSVIKTAAGNIGVTATLTVAATTIFDLATNQLTAVTTVANTGTIRTQNTSLTPIPTGRTIGATFEYNGSGTQTVMPGAYTNLNVTGGTRDLSGAADINVAGTLTAGAGTTINGGTSNVRLNGGTQTISLGASGSFNNFRCIGTGNKSVTASTGALNVNGELEVLATRVLTMNNNAIGGAPTSTTGTGTITTTCVTAPLPAGVTWTMGVQLLATVAQEAPGGTFALLTIGATGLKTATGNITVNTTLTFTGPLDMSTFDLAGTFTSSGTGNLTTAGSLPTGKTWTSTTVSYNGAGSQTVVIGTYINLTISGGARTLESGGDINLTGTLTAGASATITGGTSNVRLTGAAQNITLGASGAFNNFRCIGTGNKTVTTGTLTVDGELEVLATRTLIMGTNALAGTLTTTTGTGIISTTCVTAPFPSGITWVPTVQLNAGVAQEAPGGTFDNLTIGATGIKTATGNITVNTALVLTGPLVMSSFNLAGAFTQTGVGTLTTAGTIPNGKTWTAATVLFNSLSAQTVSNGTYVALNVNGGDRTYDNASPIVVTGAFTASTAGVTHTTTGNTFTFSGGAQTLTFGTATFNFNNVNFTGSSVTKTIAGGSFGVSGDLNIAAGIALNMATFNLNAVGTVSGTGNLRTQSTATTALPASITWPYRVFYDANGNQSIAVGTYADLFCTGTSGTRTKTIFGSGSVVVQDTLSINSFAVLIIASHTLEIQGLIDASATGTITGGVTSNITFNTSTSSTSLRMTQTSASTRTVNDLVVDRTGAVITMVNALDINNSLTLTNGQLAIGSNTLTIATGNVNLTAANNLVANGSSNIVLSGLGAWTSNLILDMTNPGTTNALNNFTQGRNTTIELNQNTIVNGTLTFSNSGKLAIGANTLTLNGGVTNTATQGLVCSASSQLVCAGTANRTLSFDQTNPGTTNSLLNYTNNTTGGGIVTLGNQLRIRGTLFPTSGELASAGNLVMVSNATDSSRVDIAGAGATVTGNVTVQRWVSSISRNWRFLTPSVTSTNVDDWQNEIYITGPGGSVNGFDSSANNVGTLFSYNEALSGSSSIGWTSVTDSAATLSGGRGYRVFVRGDRSDVNRLFGLNLTQNEVVLTSVGTLMMGDVNLPVSFTNNGSPSNDGWSLVGNPYVSAIDWNDYYDNCAGCYTNIEPTAYIFSPVTNGYVSYNANINSGTLANGIIPPGAAIYLKANGVGTSLTMKEAHKVSSAHNRVFKSGVVDELNLGLSMSGSSNADVFILKHSPSATNQHDDFDIRKLNGAVNLSSYGTDNVYHALDARPELTANDTIQLYVSGANGTYAITVNTLPFNSNTYYLVDRKLGSSALLNLGHTHSFSMNSTDSASWGKRFYIVATNPGALPVKLIQFTGTAIDAGSSIKWATSQEVNNKQFELQRSFDNAQFATIGTVSGNNGNTLQQYTWLDATASRKTPNYYRLKQVDFSGAFSYSSVIMVEFTKGGQAQFVEKAWPNSVTSDYNIALSPSSYSIELIDLNGKQWYASKFNNENDNRVFTLDASSLPAGIYVVKLMDMISNNATTLKMVKE
jgi:hypothetical protein